MLQNDVIYQELWRLIRLTDKLTTQVCELTERLELIEKPAPKPVLAEA